MQNSACVLLAQLSGPVDRPCMHLRDTEKSHDDVILAMKHSHVLLCARSPPSTSIGERECVCGPRCLATFIAKVRYGPANDKGFVCKEFLLPQQHADFLAGKGLPAQRQKCLLCTRYYQVRPTCTCLHVASSADTCTPLVRRRTSTSRAARTPTSALRPRSPCRPLPTRWPSPPSRTTRRS